MQCPKCKSEDAVKLSLVHAAGLSDVKTRSRGHGLALGDGGLLLGFGSSKAAGTSQTQLSKLAAPTHKKRYRHVIIAWFIGLAIGNWFILVINAPTARLDPHTLSQTHWFTYGFSALLVLILAVLWRFNHMVLPRRCELWNNSFMCQHCGEIFQP
ncbi:MAG: hypothetical protein EPN47_18325 [Acidobacteria bacterium]|nr:MAG: hypothetical protein EPN47_18325 [Acidobacteriota bacterium]